MGYRNRYHRVGPIHPSIMPYVLRKMPNQSCYRVYNRRTKKVMAKCSSLENAERQMRLLRAIEYGNFKPTGKPARGVTRRRGGATRRRSP